MVRLRSRATKVQQLCKKYKGEIAISLSMTEIVVVLTTVADNDGAETFARQLVEERLAACVNLHPAMLSFYRWQGQVTRDAERQIVIKTTRDRVPALEARLKALHTYDLPEFLVLPVEQGSEAYLAWASEQVQ
jgi:periplasmic divalent cation tolerance protein